MHLVTPACVRIRGLLRILCITGLGIALGAGARAVSAATYYTHLTLIDGTGAPAARDMAVVVEGERIRAVQPSASLEPSPATGDSVVDLTGKFALPGLIDTHVHLGTFPNPRIAEANLLRCIYGGITAVRDMAGDARFLANLSRSALLQEIPSPDIYYSALMAGPAFFSDPRTRQSSQGATPGRVPWLQAITGKTDMPTAVALARGTGASGIKIYADLPAKEVRRIVAEAHRQGLVVWSHATIFPATPLEAVKAGVDSISHAYLLGFQGVHPPPGLAVRGRGLDAQSVLNDERELPELFAAMRERGTILDATLYVEWSRKDRDDPSSRARLSARWAAQAHRAGVSLSTGTDSPSDVDDPYPSVQKEMELLVSQAGLT
ncbi:MAG TPA: amidohydrolase family protein, partial [Anaeromyxobacteraceae bacterium]|nr:amidohydrolase family protein [Anaeromyxobacteraceae bacterium]